MISLLYFLFSSLACVAVSNTIGFFRKESPVGDRPKVADCYVGSATFKIFDVVHEMFPIVNLPYASDILIFLQTMYSIAMVDILELEKLFFVLGTVQCLRILCFSTTVLPPLKTYSEKYRIGGLNGTGNEYIFSGHACYACVSAISLYEKGIDLRLLVFYNTVSQSLIVLSRNHYTVDVVLAWIITPLVYNVF